jgi:hypothetical protein
VTDAVEKLESATEAASGSCFDNPLSARVWAVCSASRISGLVDVTDGAVTEVAPVEASSLPWEPVVEGAGLDVSWGLGCEAVRPLAACAYEKAAADILGAEVEVTAMQVDTECTMGGDRPGRANRYEP